MEDRAYDLAELESVAAQILVNFGAAETNAKSVARALAAAQRDGQQGHGLSRLSSYGPQVQSGKIDGSVQPALTPSRAGTAQVDAKHGFAYPALDLAIDWLTQSAAENGIATAGIYNSHHAGVAGLPVERLADQGLIALFFTNSPAAIAPHGGNKALFGTNPIAFAAPTKGEDPSLVIDLSMSKVARGKIMVAAKNDEQIPEGWALDKDGQDTSDPKAALEGSMLALEGAKGYALALMVELLAAGLTGGKYGFEASSFFSADGPSPSIGQLLIAIDPTAIFPNAGNDALFERFAVLFDAIEAQEGARLPGQSRLKNRDEAKMNGIRLSPQLREELSSLPSKS